MNIKINVDERNNAMPSTINSAELKSINSVLRPQALNFFKRYTCSLHHINDIVEFMIDAGEWINIMKSSLDVASFVRILEFGLDVPHDEPDYLKTRSWYMSTDHRSGYKRTKGYKFVCNIQSKQWRWEYANPNCLDPKAYGVGNLSELASKIESLKSGQSISIGLFRKWDNKASGWGEYELFLKLEKKKGGRYRVSLVEG